ncbi:hypothetical protein [Pseudomonas sp. TH31]|uniref:hypothetical protein n=1 Tax=Pseudomonas sp. TH31 TaxID=2796396 RepID=UPI001911EB1E|nr:hypothetical protein [Pseudomonas sp. TH31]MBK5416378.1 hypothetical protein [Pseudomonas sp. TH31]
MTTEGNTMESKIQQLAQTMGVSEADVLLFAQLAVTQLKAGKEGVEAINAASETMTALCHRAFINKDDFTVTLYDMVAA